MVKNKRVFGKVVEMNIDSEETSTQSKYTGNVNMKFNKKSLK